MRFSNENGEEINLADNLTLKELIDMGVSVSVSEDLDPNNAIWLAEPENNEH
ncbi:hypothetical protein [Motilimonas pumila]|uniref:hypothetical protein n=1 Tax=Motilimonas pumila TaxID=2303987 RepID=UPI0018E083DD|nr:hypothetical protein [Motilimonas pumila]